jgi:hypothetical protein
MSRAKYDAFISYSRELDRPIAVALTYGLGRFAKPILNVRALNIFRDDDSLSANPSLWHAIEGALSSSRFFILLASRPAVQSSWVSKELAWWCANRSVDQVLVVLTDSDLDSWQEHHTTSMPEVFLRYLEGEPRWVDLRWARDGNDVDISLANPRFRGVIADIAAPLHGRAKDKLIGIDVAAARKLRRYAVSAISALIVFFLLACIAAIVSVRQRNEAVRAQNAAEVARVQARAERDATLVAKDLERQARQQAERAQEEAEIERRAAVAARELEKQARVAAESEKEKALKTLVAAVDHLTDFSDSIISTVSEQRNIPSRTRLQVLELSEDALWTFAVQNDLGAVRQTVFVNTLEKISASYAGAGASRESARAWHRVVQLNRHLVQRNPRYPGLRSALAASLVKLSYHKAALNDRVGQQRDLREAVDIYRHALTMPYTNRGDGNTVIPEKEFRRIVAENLERFSRELEQLPMIAPRN